MADDDGLSVRTPTKSEMNTFKVLANLDFADLRRADPSSGAWQDPNLRQDPKQEKQDPKQAEETWMASSLPPTPKLNAKASSKKNDNEDTESEHSARYERRRRDERDDRSESTHDDRRDLRDRSRADHGDHRRDEHDLGRRDEHDDRRDEHDDRQGDRVPEKEEPKRPELEADVVLEKEALLYEIEMMEKQGLIKLHRELTMADSLDVIQYQYDRANMIVSTQQTVDWAKSGIKIGSNLLEMLMKKFGLNIVDGFSNNLCKDMSKFNKPLTKMYRKYWRRGTSSPESELAMIVFGALAVTVMANKGLTGNPPKPAPTTAPLGGAFSSGKSDQQSTMPSTMPSMNSMNSVPSMKAPAPPPIPEWAKAAMASPLPTHFAKDSFTELGPERAPVIPVSAIRSIEPERVLAPEKFASSEKPAERVSDRVSDRTIDRPDRPERHLMATKSDYDEPVTSSAALPVSSSVVVDTTRKLTLSSPRSSRRKREMQSELNLDA